MLRDNFSLQDDGWSPLFIAVYHGYLDVIDVLLSHGADVNHANKDGASPLYFAAYTGQEAAFDVLLAHGADVHQATVFGRKPIDVAKTQKIKDILIARTKEKQPESDQAVSHMVDESQWFQAAKKGDLAVIQQGINDKIDVNCRDSYGGTAISWAAWGGHLELVKYLFSLHAELSFAYGTSVLSSAAIEGHSEVIVFLLSKGVNINETNNDGWTALHFAAFKGHDVVVAVLLSHGADVNQANNDGRSPLHEAADKGHEEVVAVLLSHGADANKTDIDGDKPLDVTRHQKIKDMLIPLTTEQQEDQQQAVSKIVDEALWFRAAKKGNLALIQQGINDKIDINCRGSRGRTALYHGAEQGHVLLVEYLISQNADLSITTVNILG